MSTREMIITYHQFCLAINNNNNSNSNTDIEYYKKQISGSFLSIKQDKIGSNEIKNIKQKIIII